MKHVYGCLFALAVAAAPFAAGAQTANLPCNPDKILNTDTGGAWIRMGSGQYFKVYPGDNRLVLNWLPLDKVEVCAIGGNAVKITNLSEKNQEIKALRQNP
jgi:hypothetical protein